MRRFRILALTFLILVAGAIRSVAEHDVALLERAESGNPQAQFEVGKYEWDSRNCAQAAYWWRKAADQGFSPAQYSLGFAYWVGSGVPQDYVQATYWWRKAADQGNARAQYSLGIAYWEGKGVLQDYAQAVSWWRKVADLGNAEAQTYLGIAYWEGKGVPQDYAQAVYWWRKAADQEDATAQCNLGLAFWEGKGVRQDYYLAVLWWEKCAENVTHGEVGAKAVARYFLGNAYFEGKGVKQDFQKATGLWNLSAGWGDYAPALYMLGYACEHGLGYPKNIPEAIYYYQQAAKKGYAYAKQRLAVLEGNKR